MVAWQFVEEHIEDAKRLGTQLKERSTCRVAIADT